MKIFSTKFKKPDITDDITYIFVQQQFLHLVQIISWFYLLYDAPIKHHLLSIGKLPIHTNSLGHFPQNTQTQKIVTWVFEYVQCYLTILSSFLRILFTCDGGIVPFLCARSQIVGHSGKWIQKLSSMCDCVVMANTRRTLTVDVVVGRSHF